MPSGQSNVFILLSFVLRFAKTSVFVDWNRLVSGDTSLVLYPLLPLCFWHFMIYKDFWKVVGLFNFPVAISEAVFLANVNRCLLP